MENANIKAEHEMDININLLRNDAKEALGNAGLSSVVIPKISDGGFVSF